MGVNRLNLVQKATCFLKKSKVGKNEECTVTVKTATDQLNIMNNNIMTLTTSFQSNGLPPDSGLVSSV